MVTFDWLKPPPQLAEVLAQIKLIPEDRQQEALERALEWCTSWRNSYPGMSDHLLFGLRAVLYWVSK